MNPPNKPIPLEKLNQMKAELLNKDTDTVLEDYDNNKRLAVGLIVLMFAGLVILAIYASVSYTENKAMQSKIDSLKVSNQRLEDNLLMPQMIKDELEQR